MRKGVVRSNRHRKTRAHCQLSILYSNLESSRIGHINDGCRKVVPIIAGCRNEGIMIHVSTACPYVYFMHVVRSRRYVGEMSEKCLFQNGVLVEDFRE